MKKSKVKKVIRDMIVKHYGEAGYTATADRFLRESNKLLDKLFNQK